MAKAVKGAFKWVAKLALGAAGFAIKPIVRALTPKAPEVDSSSSVNFRADPNAGVPYIIGQTGTAGIYTYATVGEAKNRNLLFYTILGGGGPIDSFVSFKMGDVSVVFDGPDTPESGPYRHLVWMRKQLGTAGAPALLPPNTLDAGVLAEWTSAHKTTGYAAAWYVLGADQTAYSNGVPDPMWEIKGVRVYDWRDDDTYPGGSGPQRLADPTTWLFNENPAVHAVAWCLGRYQNGKRVLGLGASLSQIAMAKATEWANVCDANGWKVGGVVYSTDTKWQVLKAICQAGGGYPTPLGTQVSFIFNAPRVSIATLTGADIEADPSIVGAQLRRDRFNRGVARYREKNNGWQIVPSAPLTVAEFVTQDGGITRTKEFEWPLVQNVDQAAQLLAYAMCNSRELGPLEFAVIPSWAGLDPGDCITINEPEFGLTNQKVVVTARSRSLDDFGRSLTCVTETDSKHAFCLGQSGTPPPLPSLTAVDTLPTPPDGEDWLISEGEVAGPGGTLPAIILTGGVSDPNAIAVIVEYREVISPGVYGTWVGNEYPITTTRIEITGLKPGAKYQVQVRYRYARNTEDPTGGNLDLGEIIVAPISAPVPPDVLADIAAAQSAADAAQLDADAALTALFDPTSGAIAEINTLQSGQATHSSQIAVLQTDSTSSAGRITTLEGITKTNPNLLSDPSFANGVSSLTPFRNTGGDWILGVDASGRYLYSTTAPGSGFVNGYTSEWVSCPAGSTMSVAADYQYNSVTSGSVLLDIEWGTSGHANNGYSSSVSAGSALWPRVSVTATAPAGTAYCRLRFHMANTVFGAGGYVRIRRPKIESGPISTLYSDDGSSAAITARVSTNEIAVATNTAAIAATDTRVGVSMQQGSYINANARFGAFTTTPGLPDGWPSLFGTAPAASRFSRQVGEGANFSVRAAPTATEELGFLQSVTLTAGKYLLTFEGKCNSGNWSGAGLTISGVYSINCLTDADLSGVTGAGGTGVRRWSKIVTVAAGTYNFHAMYGYATFGTITAKSLDLYVVGIQPLDAAGQTALTASADATSALIAAATVDSALAAYESTANARLDGLDASVSTQGTAISNLQGRTASWLTKVAAAGADPAYIYMQSDATAAGGTDSYIALVAKSLFLFNTVGGVLVPALSLTGGNAYFPGTIFAGPTENCIVDGPNKRFLVKDGSGNIVCEMGQLL